MNYHNNVRLAGLAVFLLSVVCLGAAVYLQEARQWYPCALCVVQRYVYVATGALGLALAAGSGFARTVLLGLTALGGTLTALYHVWILANPGSTCGVDPLQVWLNELPWVEYSEILFMSDGLCSDQYPPLLGISLPGWSAIGFAMQTVLAFWAARQAVRTRRIFTS